MAFEVRRLKGFGGFASRRGLNGQDLKGSKGYEPKRVGRTASPKKAETQKTSPPWLNERVQNFNRRRFPIRLWKDFETQA